MTSERRKRLQEILQSALNRGPEKRGAFLKQAFGADESLRKQGEALMTNEDALTIIGTPTIDSSGITTHQANSQVGIIEAQPRRRP